ncbi:permease-like cell division protein FtsX [Candidatus Saccharibacteria bacterium]|nr:permease-like cell division protein FtsX [Candidatus Saccharibacteria bacterium]MCB9821358.1 FtsX-like permease family protein [Candidatus Nomurabacteria bacterium]
MMRTLARIFTNGVRGFIRNSWLSIAATAVMVVAISIILMALVLNTTAKNAITELNKNLKTSIYLFDNSPVSVRNQLRAELTRQDFVSTVDYIDKQMAQQRFNDIFSEEAGITEGLEITGGGIFPESFEVSVNDLSRIKEIETIAQKEEYKSVVDKISLAKTEAEKTIERAHAAQKFVVRAGVISSLVFAGVSILIIFNTIRMAIFTRSEEIHIMKLIGATPSYIRGPFLVEASMYGVIAGIIAFFGVYSLIASIGSKMATQPEFAATYTYFQEPSTIIFLLLCAITGGILVGVISSMLAMEKHLRLKNW